jgi:hypothetical protein
MPEIRLGDIIDDHCARCRRLTDHSVVAMVGDEVRKVRCRSCYSEHDYRRGKAAARKNKPSAYEQVLASIQPMPQPTAPQKTGRARKSRS